MGVKAVITIFQDETSRKFKFSIQIKDKSIDPLFGQITSKLFSKEEVCKEKAEEFVKSIGAEYKLAKVKK